MEVRNSTMADIDEIYRLYHLATAFQKTRFTVHWPDFDRSMVETEIAEHRQWKITIGQTTACVWATTFQDPLIWEERNNDRAVYIHRIATNPEFRGKEFVLSIVAWSRTYAAAHGCDYIRLDTVGNNLKLIEYYSRCGFTFLGAVTLKNIGGLPAHYGAGPVCLFEIAL